MLGGDWRRGRVQLLSRNISNREYALSNSAAPPLVAVLVCRFMHVPLITWKATAFALQFACLSASNFVGQKLIDPTKHMHHNNGPTKSCR
ncbi:hypothetical protein C1H46_044578 [Malus baccata]|uniref:Uncharacterized protein n=1 Tax=Malus baccata TaxID=106549 RepID=A0A540K6P7_MALBA|nr:hypothetical protein C1H46_044578 [Malus baccata]